jgi:hypothetical protein
VRTARSDLLLARILEWEGLLARVDSVSTPQDSLDLATTIEDTRFRIEALRQAENPPETLEPEPDIVITRTDTPAQIRAKATFLDLRADQAEAQLVEYGRRLEQLQREQSLERRSQDFLDGVARYDAATLPVAAVRPGQPTEAGDIPVVDTLGGQTAPLSLEERIQSLLLLQVALTERIQRVRAKAQNFRRQAGGEWAQ